MFLLSSISLGRSKTEGLETSLNNRSYLLANH